jgi:exonuclease III
VDTFLAQEQCSQPRIGQTPRTTTTDRTRTNDFVYVYIATINIGTLNDKVEEVTEIMQARKVKFLGIAETRWKGQGQRRIHNDYEMYYSGSMNDTRHGVGIVLDPEFAEYVEKVHYVNNRIIAVTLNIANYRTSLIQAYAPQQGRPQEEKDLFLENLQDTMDLLPNDSDILVLGDLNCHIGSIRVEGVVGNFGVGQRNDEGEQMIDFCVRNSLSVMNTYFQHQDSHTYTWYRYNNQLGSYDQKTQIDFILSSKKSIIKDVMAIPSESLDSDHRMVRGKLKIHLPAKAKTQTRKRVKIENIPENKQEIEAAVRDKAEEIKSDNIEEYWQNLRNHLQDIQEDIVGMKTVGRPKKKKTGWWTDEVKIEVDKKRTLFKEWLKLRTQPSRQAYVNQRRYVNMIKKQAKKAMWTNIGQDLENDVQGTKKLLYSMAKGYKSRLDDKPKNASLKYVNGEIVTGNDKVADRWLEYFEDLLNVPDESDEDTSNDQNEDDDDAIDENPITMQELEEALKLTRDNKSPGPDQIPVETLKAGGDSLKMLLLDLMNLAWRTGTVPDHWNKSIICPIYKNKGDPLDCKNYRGISLMSHAGKIYERILEIRLRRQVEESLSESQCGFRPGRGTVDQIAALRLYLEKCWEHNIDQYLCFLDLEKAFDRVPRKKIWDVLHQSGINRQLLKAIKSTYYSQQSTVTGGGTYFEVKSGVRQGSVLSPLLFIAYLNQVMIRIEREDFKAERFGYADDVGQSADSLQRLEAIMNQWDSELRAAGLKLSYSKTEVMKVGRTPEEGVVIVNGQTLKETEEFVYLGSKITADNLIACEIQHRIAKFTGNLNCLYPLLKQKEIPTEVKVVIYTTILRPVLLYGSETWTLTKRLKSKIQACEMRILRLIFGVTRRDRIRNEVIRDSLKVQSILSIVERNQLRWFGHILRMPDTRDVKRMYQWKPTNKRPLGRPRKRFKDQIKEITSKEIVDFSTVELLTQDRSEWRSFTKRLTTNR